MCKNRRLMQYISRITPNLSIHAFSFRVLHKLFSDPNESTGNGIILTQGEKQKKKGRMFRRKSVRERQRKKRKMGKRGEKKVLQGTWCK